jgi:NAD+ kinase
LLQTLLINIFQRSIKISMIVSVFGKDRNATKNLIRKCFRDFGEDIEFYNPKIKGKKPDFAICIGGDGTLFYAERKLPEVPKIFIKWKGDLEKIRFDRLVEKILNKEYNILQIPKIAAFLDKNKKNIKIGINDINIHYKPPYALRFSIKINSKVKKNVIGDGIVVATPYGSSGYFKSITRKVFKEGIGIAFNNPTERIEPIFINEFFKKDLKVKVYVLRGNGFLTADNDSNILRIKEGDIITIKKYNRNAKLVKIKGKIIEDEK